jgi:hypothetical protein
MMKRLLIEKVCYQFILLPFLLALSTVLAVNNGLANVVVSGKYFWFYGSMGLLTFVGVFYRRGRKEAQRFFFWMCWFCVFLQVFVFPLCCLTRLRKIRPNSHY